MGNWSNAPRVPLGVLQQGECRAQTTVFRPNPEQLTQQCNVGYSRGLCQCFPLDAEADSFRFHVATDRGNKLEIQYVVEKACWPLRHGVLDIDLETPMEQNILRQQALAFATSYSRRRDG